MTSVREAVHVVGQAVSTKELAHQSNESPSLSLRKFAGALSPGRIPKKVIPLDFLQRKCDWFFNKGSGLSFRLCFDGKDFDNITFAAEVQQ